MKLSIVWIFLAFCGSAWAGSTEDEYDARLDKAFYLFRAAAHIQGAPSSEALVLNSRRIAAEAVAAVFFQDALVFDRERVKQLSLRLKTHLKEGSEHLPRELIQELILAFNQKLKTLKSRNDYSKDAWRRSLVVALFVPSILELIDWLLDKFFGLKTMNRNIQRSGAWLRVKSGCCKYAFVQLALKGVGDALRRFPRASFYALGSPLLFGLSQQFYFKHMENWDPTEEEVIDEIIPLLRELSKID